MEPVCYEAEWAYLPCYDDLGKKSKPIVYVPDADCSGKIKISRLGGREENFAEWSEVYQSFYAAFYKNVGETPNGYRKKHLENKK